MRFERFVPKCYYSYMESNRFENNFAIHDFDDPARTCGQRIRFCREKKGISIQEFANLLNRDYSFVVKYETDKRKPKDDLLIEIGNILGVSPLYLKYGQYYDEIDDDGGIAIHYYTNTKYSSKNKETNNNDLTQLRKNIAFLSNSKNNELNYVKILKDISSYLADIKIKNSNEFKKMLSKAVKNKT